MVDDRIISDKGSSDSSPSKDVSTTNKDDNGLLEKILPFSPIIIVVFLIICLLLYYSYHIKSNEGFMNLWTKTNIDFNDIDMFYINLDRAHKRRADLEMQFKQQDLQVKRFPAVDARKLPNEAVAKVLQHPRSQNFLKSVLVDNRKNIGHFGCFLSHIGVYNEFMKSDKPYCLIFEEFCFLDRCLLKTGIGI